MTDMVSTLDLTPGITVQRAGKTGLLRVSEIREPSHPLMPGLVVAGHYWRADERRYSERETAVNMTDVTARKVSDSIFGTEFREIHESRYVVTSNVTVADPDDPGETMPIFDGPADAMAERLIPGTYTDLDGREWTVTAR